MNLLVFYLFSSIITLSALAVILVRNPIHSVLFLILCFFSSAGIFLLQGAEFLAFTLIIVYVGAVAILFLFVIMMLNIDFKAFKKNFVKNLPIGLVVALILLIEISIVLTYDFKSEEFAPTSYPINPDYTNTHALGELLYVDFFFHFELVGIILLIGMIGAVMLTNRKRKNVRKQNISEQIKRSKKSSIKVVKVLSGKGI